MSENRFNSLSDTCRITPSRVGMRSSPDFWSSLVSCLVLHPGSSMGLRVFLTVFSVSWKVAGIFYFFILGSGRVPRLSKGIFFVSFDFQDLDLYSGALKCVISNRLFL